MIIRPSNQQDDSEQTPGFALQSVFGFRKGEHSRSNLLLPHNDSTAEYLKRLRTQADIDQQRHIDEQVIASELAKDSSTQTSSGDSALDADVEAMQDSIDAGLQADQEQFDPANQTVLCVNAVQRARVKDLILEFKKRKTKTVYNGGALHSDDSQKVRLIALGRGIDRSSKVAAKFVRSSRLTSTESGKNYTTSFPAVLGAAIDMHSVLDLFHKACKLLPGFEQASAQRYKETIAALVAKQAVAPIPYVGSEPPLVFDSPLLERSRILPSDFLNALGIGTTGSGKTWSLILPTLFSMMEYRLAGGKTCSILVVDPKVELLTGIESKLKELGELDRLVVVGRCAPIDYFDDNDGLSLADRFEKVKSFVMVTGASANSTDQRWQAFADQLILSFLKDDQKFSDACRFPLLESIAAMMTGDVGYLERNQWVALRNILLLGLESQLNLRHLSDVYDVLTMGVGMTSMDRPFARYLAIDDRDQYFYNARGALGVVDSLGSQDIEQLMDFSVRRNLAKKNRTDVAALVARGAVLVLQPRQTTTHDLVGRALKSLFFRSVMERKDMERPMGYIADEFQRFITSDPETGEHTFLDRCRAYRVNCVLATQSMAALLAAAGRGGNSASAIDSILVNCPTKLCFRTTDDTAVSTMKAFIPRDPRSEQHILNFRAPSTLLTGEYYYCFKHFWGRTRYQLPARQESNSGVLKIQQGD
ncbi:MAG: type IV secretory system conjugative DNA transfer family protein [Rhodoferax sp.]